MVKQPRLSLHLSACLSASLLPSLFSAPLSPSHSFLLLFWFHFPDHGHDFPPQCCLLTLPFLLASFAPTPDTIRPSLHPARLTPVPPALTGTAADLCLRFPSAPSPLSWSSASPTLGTWVWFHVGGRGSPLLHMVDCPAPERSPIPDQTLAAILLGPPWG